MITCIFITYIYTYYSKMPFKTCAKALSVEVYGDIQCNAGVYSLSYISIKTVGQHHWQKNLALLNRSDPLSSHKSSPNHFSLGSTISIFLQDTRAALHAEFFHFEQPSDLICSDSIFRNHSYFKSVDSRILTNSAYADVFPTGLRALCFPGGV